MNGVCCWRLLDNVEDIFKEVREESMRTLRMKSNLKEKEIEILTSVLNDFFSLFQLLDLVFSRLRVCDPSTEEIGKTEKAIKKLETMWRKLELNITPKCHILFDHTIEQVVKRKGIADLAEDFVEKSHQAGKRLDHLVSRMNSQCFCQQELVKIRRRWLKSDPQILDQFD